MSRCACCRDICNMRNLVTAQSVHVLAPRTQHHSRRRSKMQSSLNKRVCPIGSRPRNAALVPSTQRQVPRRNVQLRFKESERENSAAAPTLSKELEDKCVNTIRFLAMDAVNKAKSGHPGMPMGNAPIGYILFNEFMRYNPKNPEWLNRDRFVLSNGHGCMLQYALLHLTGYDSVQMDDIKQLRQWGSRTPGHPEHLLTPGIEVTTGPLGQGIGNAVGLAVAEAHLAARFNKPDTPKIVDHHTYVFMSDGDMMEGISNEACSLAGHWGLGKLIAFYDDNKISIDGSTKLAFTEDVGKRYEALGWHVLSVEDGDNDYAAIREAVEKAKAETDRPSLIKVRTTIGYGSPKMAGTDKIHGAAVGADEAEATRKNLNWQYKEFEVPKDVYDVYRKAISKGAEAEQQWRDDCNAYAAKYPKEWEEFQQLISSQLPHDWASALPTFSPDDKPMATRQYSQTVLNALAPVLPGLIGGSADLAPSNLTLMKMFGDFEKGKWAERNMRFGVREHGMAAICNGLALHNSGLIPYCGTFFNFTDYMRGAMRMSAISHAGVLYVTTHDSIGLGEDGTTHQPVEQLTAFRAMPNMLVMRPAGGNEVSGAYKVAIDNTQRRPTTLVLSRQKMATLPGTSLEGATKGGYIVKDSDGTPDVILMGTGSELEIAYRAAEALESEGHKARVVSIPCWELFDEQPQEYRDSVLPPHVNARVSVEAGASLCWYKYLGHEGKHVGLDMFGSSAPPDVLYEQYGITKENVVKQAKALINKK